MFVQVTLRKFLKSLATVAACLTILGFLYSCSGGNCPEPKPNFIVIFTDDQGYKIHLWREPLSLIPLAPYETDELYYLPEDISEEQNIYADYPEKVAELRAAAEQFDVELLRNTRPVGESL